MRMIDIKCSREGTKCTDCPIKRDCDFIEVTEDVDPYAFYKKGRADRNKEFQKQFDMMYVDKLEQVRADERTRAIELYNETLINEMCNEGFTVYQWNLFEKVLKRAYKQLKEQNNE